MKLPRKLADMELYVPETRVFDIRLDTNESFLEPPAGLREKIARAVLECRLNRYPDPFSSRLCAAASDWFGVSADCCVAGNGSDELIQIIISSLLDRGARVAVADPDFSMYRFYSGLCELEIVNAGREDGRLSAEKLIEASKTVDLLIFSNPCNPTGQGLEASEARRVIKNASCLVALDEAYMDFWDQSVLRDIESSGNLIVLRTCSKAFGMAGIRLGFAFAQKGIIDILKSVKSPFNVSSLTQAVGLCVLEERDYLRRCADEIVVSKNSLHQKAASLLKGKDGFEVIDTVTNFILIKTPNAGKIHALLCERGVSVRHVNGMLRVTAGSNDENAQFMRRLEEVLAL